MKAATVTVIPERRTITIRETGRGWRAGSSAHAHESLELAYDAALRLRRNARQRGSGPVTAPIRIVTTTSRGHKVAWAFHRRTGATISTVRV